MTHRFGAVVRTVLMKGSSQLVASISAGEREERRPVRGCEVNLLEMWRDCATTSTNIRLSSSESVDSSCGR